ncbi:MAG TPA: NAD(P)-binding protein, partial [Pelobium sp.]|nr:NAD(P)-binding protein [Pelobium sp.]
MRIGVLGAGISGLSIAKLLSPNHDVEVLEQNSFIGGIARTKNINGIAYHPIGGHCFNSKYPEVLDFVFKKVLPKENWHSVKRKAVIRFKNHIIPYPIEYSINEIFKFDNNLAIDIAKDFLSTNENSQPENLEEWFRVKFGNTLSDHYFIPYNHK